VRVYLDTSAVVKLVQVESGSVALRRYLRRHRSRTVVADLRAVVTGDQRTSAAAAALSLPTVAPVQRTRAALSSYHADSAQAKRIKPA
jgi:hypothetical protein